jgi:transposase InsO family protein
MAEIHAAHAASRGTYGAPRVHAELAAKGICVGRKRVARLMSRAGLAGVSRRRFVTTTFKGDGHSDQGSQYTSIEFGRRCREAGVRSSMGSVGDSYDNAMCESFFATLECELLDRCRFRTQAEARTAVFQFIEGFYNPRRRHSGIGYLSPIDYERRHHAMIAVTGGRQPAAVLAAVKHASRRLRRSPAAILDRRCARPTHHPEQLATQ